MKVVEKFTSINGEGTRAGELAVFIRFKGCNLRCSYCDTMWANEPDCQYKEETSEEILNYVLGTGIRNVTLTGGEPLLHPEFNHYTKYLQENTNFPNSLIDNLFSVSTTVLLPTPGIAAVPLTDPALDAIVN